MVAESQYRVEHESTSQGLIIRLIGEIGLNAINSLSDDIQRLYNLHTTVVIDFSRCSFIASLGMGILISLQKHIVDNGGSVRLCCLSDELHNALHLAGLLRYFPIFGNEHAALAAGNVSHPAVTPQTDSK